MDACGTTSIAAGDRLMQFSVHARRSWNGNSKRKTGRESVQERGRTGVAWCWCQTTACSIDGHGQGSGSSSFDSLFAPLCSRFDVKKMGKVQLAFPTSHLFAVIPSLESLKIVQVGHQSSVFIQRVERLIYIGVDEMGRMLRGRRGAQTGCVAHFAAGLRDAFFQTGRRAVCKWSWFPTHGQASYRRYKSKNFDMLILWSRTCEGTAISLQKHSLWPWWDSKVGQVATLSGQFIDTAALRSRRCKPFRTTAATRYWSACHETHLITER